MRQQNASPDPMDPATSLVAGAARGEAAAGDLGDAAGGARGCGRRRRLRGCARLHASDVGREDFDPGGERELKCGRVVAGEVEVVAAAGAGVAVVADPAERGTGAVLDRLGPLGETGDPGPGAVALAVAVPVQRHEVDRQ